MSAEQPAADLTVTMISCPEVHTDNNAAVQVSRGLAIGGGLEHGGGASSTINGPAYVGATATGDFVFANGVFPNTPVYQALFPWVLFEDIAKTAVAGTFEQGGTSYRVIVVAAGGTYTSDDFGVTAEDGSRTMVVFNTFEDVVLDATGSGGAFSASVLAPFSSLVVKGTTGQVNGLIVAKRYGIAYTASAGNLPAGAGLVIGGSAYEGPLFCGDVTATSGVAPLAPTHAPSDQPTTAAPVTRAPATAAPSSHAPVPAESSDNREGGVDAAARSSAKSAKKGSSEVADAIDRLDGGSGSGSGGLDRVDGAVDPLGKSKLPKPTKGPKVKKEKKVKPGKKEGKALDGASPNTHHGSIAAATFTVSAVGIVALIAAHRRLRARSQVDSFDDDEVRCVVLASESVVHSHHHPPYRRRRDHRRHCARNWQPRAGFTCILPSTPVLCRSAHPLSILKARSLAVRNPEADSVEFPRPSRSINEPHGAYDAAEWERR